MKRLWETLTGKKSSQEPVRSLLFLDIDGVLNPYYATDLNDKTKYVHFEYEYGEWWLKRTAAAFFNSILESYDQYRTQIVWASSWESTSNTIGKQIGLPTLPYLELTNEEENRVDSLKLQSIMSYLEKHQLEDHPVVWVDDENNFPEITLWVETRSAPTLLVTPDPAEGLSASDEREIRDFLVNNK